MKSKANMLVNRLLEAEDWQPRPSDIAWTENLLRMIKDGGMWAVPMSSSIYRVNHKDRQLELVEGDALDMHSRITKVCAKLSTPYTVTIAPERRQNLMTN